MRVSEILKKCLRNKNFILGSCMVGLMVLIMVVGFFYMPYDPDVMDTEHELQFFSAAHPLGTDQFGRDILSRIMEGTRVSFLVGALTVVFGLLVFTIAALCTFVISLILVSTATPALSSTGSTIACGNSPLITVEICFVCCSPKSRSSLASSFLSSSAGFRSISSL